MTFEICCIAKGLKVTSKIPVLRTLEWYNYQHINMFQPIRFTAGLLCRQHCLCILGHWFWLHVSLSHAQTLPCSWQHTIDHVRKTDVVMKSIFSAMFAPCFIGSHGKGWSKGELFAFHVKTKDIFRLYERDSRDEYFLPCMWFTCDDSIN